MQVDMYSFGVVLWEIVTCEQPSRGQLRDFVVPQECPQAIADLQDACLHQDPALRPSAAEAGMQILQAMTDNKSSHDHVHRKIGGVWKVLHPRRKHRLPR